MTGKNTEALFTQIEQFITESRAMLESGAMMEMHGLDDQVRSLCEAVLSLSPEDRAAYEGRMQQLLLELKGLGDAMVQSRDQLANELRQLSTQKKAAHAYKIVDASDDYGKRSSDDD